MKVGGRREKMLKVAVFGVGRGGEIVAKYLSTELNTVEVIEVIDWSNPEGTYYDLEEMYQAACYFLMPYVGKVDLIVLADYTFLLVIHSLKTKWPKQKIIGMEVDFRHAPRSCQNANVVTLLANELLFQSELGSRIYQQLSCADVTFLDCSGWEGLIDTGDMSKDILKAELGKTFALANSRRPRSRPQEELLDCGEALRTEIVRFLMRANSIARPQFATIGISQRDRGLGYDDFSILHGAMRVDRSKSEPPSVVYLLGTHFWTIAQDLQELLGYNVAVVDFRRKLLHDVCLALKLRGVDGRLGE